MSSKLLAWVNSRRSQSTRAAYRRDIKRWLTFCKERKINASNPAPAHAIAFRDDLLASMAPLTVRRVLACLCAAFSATQPTKANPFSERALPRPSSASFSRTEALPDDAARTMLGYLKESGDHRGLALLSILWATGMRRGSAVSIRREGLIVRDGVTVVRHVIKGGKEVESELPAECAGYVASWLSVAPPSRWLFCTKDGTRPLKPEAVTKMVRGLGAKLGIVASPHMLRAACVTTLLDIGTPLEQVRAFVHHEDPRTTLRYDRGLRGVGVAGKLADARKGKACT